MKTLIRFSLMAIALAALPVFWPVVVEAQCGTSGPTCMTRTTLSANVSETQNFITVTSATGFTALNFVWVDAEQMQITAISGTRIAVIRGINGTPQQDHDNTDGAMTGASAHFHTNDPNFGQDCTRGVGEAAYSPWINVRTGWIWTCDAYSATGEWRATHKPQMDQNSEPTTF